jgi:hypothetical protein
MIITRHDSRNKTGVNSEMLQRHSFHQPRVSARVMERLILPLGKERLFSNRRRVCILFMARSARRTVCNCGDYEKRAAMAVPRIPFKK